MKCPRCKLLCPDGTLYCDCGNRLSPGVPPSLNLRPVPASWAARFLRRFLWLETMLSVMPCAGYAALFAFLRWFEALGPLSESLEAVIEPLLAVCSGLMHLLGVFYFLLPGMLLGPGLVKGGGFMTCYPTGLVGLAAVFCFYTAISLFGAAVLTQIRDPRVARPTSSTVFCRKSLAAARRLSRARSAPLPRGDQ